MNTLQEKHDYFKNGMAELQDVIDDMEKRQRLLLIAAYIQGAVSVLPIYSARELQEIEIDAKNYVDGIEHE